MTSKPIIWMLAALSAVACGKASEPDTPVVPDPGPDIPEVTSSGDLAWSMPEQPDIDVQSYIFPEAPFRYDVRFEYDDTNFPNPERGPYNPVSYAYQNGAIPGLQSVSSMARTRESGCSLMFSLFYLCDFLDSPISDAVLEHIAQHLANVREAGCKTIFRAAYSWYWNASNKTQQEPDAPMILRHIGQLKPIFEEFADIIYVVQMGFVGTYGEFAYTTNVNTTEEKTAIIKAVLDAVPTRRNVAVRTPTIMREALDYAMGTPFKLRDTLTAATAFDGSYKSRLGCFNDCAFVNNNDGGTYGDNVDRTLWRVMSRYVTLGGESCYQGSNTYCECIPSYTNLRTFHWSYLSNHHDIIKIWKSMGCYDDASARVGYRYVLNGAAFEGDFAAGEDLIVRLCLANYGYASLINAHDLEFIVAPADAPAAGTTYKSATDPRIWQGSHYYTHTERFILPEDLVRGRKYNLYVRIADAEPTLHDRPEYCIRFADKGIWNAEIGANLITTFTAE
ncbi:MAG: DUF4874 domain-containing protein [Bacteroidales bacterium]|nr:DUF4874 domain-containing protein [Bacteroidales bacterium]